MKPLLLSSLEEGEYYLVKANDWSPSGFDIAEFTHGKLISQSNGEDLLKILAAIVVFELP